MSRPNAEAREFTAAVINSGPCIGCGGPPTDAHHVIYKQHLRARNAPLWDAADGAPVCRDCHSAHHARSRPLPCVSLPDAALDFAFEWLGSYARDYLGRYYVGAWDDPRINRRTTNERMAA